VDRPPVLGVNDAVGGRARVEDPDEQGLPVERIAMQVKVVLEVAADPPKAIGGAVIKLASNRRPCRGKHPAHQLWQFNLCRLRKPRVGASGVAKPDVEVGRERRFGDVDAVELVQKHARRDDPLPSQQVSVAAIDQRAACELGAVGG
jgi:hypothetical protein